MYDNKESRWFKKLAVVVFLATTGIRAEVDLNGKDPLDLKNYSGLVAGGMQKARKEQGEIPTYDDEATKKMDHADNNNQSGNRAGQGSGAAAAAGGIMIGEGTMLLAIPTIPTMVAGANLIAMGIVELAQSAASGGASKDNYANKDTLKSAKNDTGKQKSTPVDYNAALTPQARQALENAGLNPEEFMNKAASGQLGNEKEIAKMFGIDEVTDEQMAEAKGLLDSKLNSVFDEKTSLTLDETEKNKSAAVANSSPAASSTSAYQGNAAKPVTSGMAGSLPGMVHSEQFDSAPSGKRSALVPPTLPMDSKEWSNILGQLGIPADGAPWEKKATAEEKLGKLGVELPRRGLNIFQKASMRYTKFDAWRKAKSVAAR